MRRRRIKRRPKTITSEWSYANEMLMTLGADRSAAPRGGGAFSRFFSRQTTKKREQENEEVAASNFYQ